MTRIIGFEFSEGRRPGGEMGDISLRVTYIRLEGGRPVAGLQHLEVSVRDLPNATEVLHKLQDLLSCIHPYVDSVAEAEALKLSEALQGFHDLEQLAGQINSMIRPET